MDWLRRAVAAAGRHFDRRAGLLIVTSRFVPGGRVTMNAACGTARVPLRRFTPASAIAAVAWAVYVTGIGYLGGTAFAENPLLGLAVGFGLSFVFGGVVKIVRQRRAPAQRAAGARRHSRRPALRSGRLRPPTGASQPVE
jgi:membrane-associated protein